MAQDLPTSTLGCTGLEVTRLGYGAAELRDQPLTGPISEDQAKAVLVAALDAGLNFIDTALDYGPSEELIGRYIGSRRSEYLLASKCGCLLGGGEHVWTREQVRRGVDQSLRRLRTDYLDLVQLHNAPADATRQGRLVEALEGLRRQGKVRWIGASTALPHLPTYLEWGAFDAFQIPYSALDRTHEHWISAAAQANLGTIIRGRVAKGESDAGLGAAKREEGTGMTHSAWWGEPGVASGSAKRWVDFQQAGLDELRAEGESRTAFSLRFTLSHPDIQTIIVGTKNPEHLRENVEAARSGPLAADVYAEAKRRLDEAGMKPAETS